MQAKTLSAPKILLSGDVRLTAFPRYRRVADSPIVGWREWVGLPDLGIARVQAKIDTGARTSALHANSIDAFERDGEAWVRFDVTGEAETVPWHEARIADRRVVRSSNGEGEMRIVIRTPLDVAGAAWPVEITLTNRVRMDLPMLVGREALAGRALVDAGRSWLLGRPEWRNARAKDTVRAPRIRTGDGEGA